MTRAVDAPPTNPVLFLDAVRAGDVAQAGALLERSPKLIATEDGHLSPLHFAVIGRVPEMVRLLLKFGANPHAGIYPHRDATSPLTIATERGYEEVVAILQQAEISKPAAPLISATEEQSNFLWQYAGSGNYEAAEILLKSGADPNAQIYASGTPMFQAYAANDECMKDLLARYGGVPNPTTAGLFRQTELAQQMIAGEARYLLDGTGGDTLAEQLLWGAACGGDPDVVRMALVHVDWPRDDPRWFTILEQPLRMWSYGAASKNWDRSTYFTCFRQVLERCEANIRGRFGLTILHSVAGAGRRLTPEARVEFATTLLDRDAKLDGRDNLLLSTPLGWACRWGAVELVRLFLARGADPTEPDAEPWATPRAWAAKMGHEAVLAELP